MDYSFKNIFFAFFVCIFLGACSATPLTESTGEYIDSAAVTAKVKAQLVDALGTQALPIKVKTYKDIVQLSGFVDSDFIKQRAGVVASKVGNVRMVRNDLLIKH